MTSGYGMRFNDIEFKLSTLKRLTKPFLKLKRVKLLMKKLGKLKAFLIKKAMIQIGCLNVIFVARNLKVHLLC